MKFALISAIWRRHALAHTMLKYAADVTAKLDAEMILVAVGSEGVASRATAEAAGWDYVEHSNVVSDKFQAGLDHAMELGADAVLVIGSDDALTLEVYQAALTAMKRGVDVWGLSDFRFVTQGPRALYWGGYSEQSGRSGESMGCGRTLSRRAIALMRGQLWPKGLMRGCDMASWSRLRALSEFFDVRVESEPTAATGGMAIDVKIGDEQVSSFESYLESAEDVDWRPILARFPEDLVDAWGLDSEELFHSRLLENAGRDRLARVGLVMIAKDAEATIERAIRCAYPIVGDMVVVVDDATTDRTEEIAHELGAQTCRLPWFGFAKQRNFASEDSHAEWQIILDSDETMDLGDLADAIDRAEKEDADAIFVTLLCHSTPGLLVPTVQARVLRKGRTQWAYRRHNDIIGIKKHVMSTAVVRSSYVGRLDACANSAIPDLLEMWERPTETLVTPDEERCHAAYNLARSYGHLADWPNVRLWTRRCRELDVNGKYETIVSVGLCATLAIDGPDAALAEAEVLSARFPDMAEIDHFIVTIRSVRWFTNGVRVPGRFATQPQPSLAFLRFFPEVAAKLGMMISFEEQPA